MKFLIRIGIGLFALLALVTFSFSLTLVRNLSVRGVPRAKEQLEYHFSLYLPDNRNSFFNEIIKGAQKAAKERHAVVSLHSIDPSRYELEMASYTGVDGIVVCPYLDDDIARRQLEKIRNNKIPLVLINHNIPSDQPWPYIGINNYNVGRKYGAAVNRIATGPLKLAVVYSDKAPGMFAERELIEIGITDSLSGKLIGPIMGFKTSKNPLDAEELIYKLFRTNPQINTLVFTDSSDTIAAVQVLIDMNLVGRVQIVGFGNDPSIIEYIRKGIIAESIVIKADLIGYEAIKALTELKATGYTSASVDTGLEIIDGNSK